MTTTDGEDRPRPELAGPRVRLRPGDERDVPVLCAILAEPEVACWWGDPEPAEFGTRRRGREERKTA
jgi:RimJ/RimL family protein N-acetyltransferase